MIELRRASPAMIADALALAGGVAVVEASEPTSAGRDLEDELRFLCDSDRVGTLQSAQTAEQIIDAGVDVLVVAGLSELPDDEIVRLDLRRNLLAGRITVFVVSEQDAVRLRRLAPNTASWVAGHWYSLEVSDEAADREARLASLRQSFEMDDATMIQRVQEGAVELDPNIAEWLALLGRGDLLDE